jgi:putative ABC transport system permease protein
MPFLRLALLNLRRHYVRTLIGAAGITFGVVAMLCVVTILQGAVRMFERILSSDSELIMFEKNVSDLFFSNVPLEAIDELGRHELVEDIEPALFGIVSSPDNPVVTCFGVRANSSRLSNAHWLHGKPEDFTDGGSLVVLGKRAADFLQATVGGSIPVGNREFEVAGIIETENGFEDGGVFMPLALSQDYFHKEGVASAATIKMTDKDRVSELKSHIESTYPSLVALENEEFNQSYSQFKIIKTTSWLVGGIAFLLGGLSVANTMTLSVFGRIREIAILRVNGFSRGQVASLIFGESILISLLGVAVGTTISLIALHVLKALPALQGYIETTLSPLLVVAVIGMSLITGIGGALYPALYAMKIKPADALRFE